MNLSELLPANSIVAGYAPSDKWAAIHGLVEHVCASGRLPADDSPRLTDAVIERERSMSTGMEHGIAIPHAALDGLEDVVAALGIVTAEEGLPFDSVDASPAHFVVLLLIPREKKLLHIRTLADVARVLGRAEVREALLAASSGAEAWHALDEAEAAGS